MDAIDINKLKAEDIDNILDEIEAKESKNESESNCDEILNQLRKKNISFIKHAIASKEIRINSKNPVTGKTLLIYAVTIGHYDLVQAMCNFGADVTIKDNDNLDAFDYAIRYGRYKITELIYYRSLSNSLGNDLKDIQQQIREKNKEAQYMLDTFKTLKIRLTSMQNKDVSVSEAMIQYMIKALKERAEFDECILYYTWYFVVNEKMKNKNPFLHELWKTMMTVYEEILQNTDDTNGWKWLKRKFIPSLIWYSAHPTNTDAQKNYYEVIFYEINKQMKGDIQKNGLQHQKGQFTKLATFYEKDAEVKLDYLKRMGNKFRVMRVNGKVVKQAGSWFNSQQALDWKAGEKLLNEYLALLDKENKERENSSEMEKTLKKTLFYELLTRVRAESRKQSNLLLKQKIDKIKTEKPNEWNELISYKVETKHSSNARQDICGCLTPQYSESDLSDKKYPPSTHFNAKKHYDTNIYLNQLLLNSNCVNAVFQTAMKSITEEINDMIKSTIEYKAGPVKTLTRSQTKVENDYINETWPKSAKILDINRCAIQFSSVPEMMKYIKIFSEKVESGTAGCIKEIIRCKNGWTFYNEEYPQYTDIKLNCLIHDGNTNIKVIAEIQFLLILMSSFKKKAHKLYAVERKFELVYNFGVLTHKMSQFKENSDSNAVFNELIQNDDVKFFKNLWESMSLNATILPSLAGNMMIDIINSETGKIHNYLNGNWKKVYCESIIYYFNTHKFVADWNCFLNDLVSNTTDEKDKNNMKLRFVNRLFEVMSDKIHNKHNFNDLEQATKTLRSVGCFQCLLDETMSSYLVQNKASNYYTLQAPSYSGDFHKHTKFKMDVKQQASVFAFGYDSKGKLGLGKEYDRNVRDAEKNPTPTNVETFNDKHVVQVACGSSHNLFIDINGNVFGCGDNTHAQLGLGKSFKSQHVIEKGSSKYANKPQQLPEFSKFKVIQVATGNEHSLILTADGTVWSFGACGYSYGRYYERPCLGHGEKPEDSKLLPKPIKAIAHIPIIDISAGEKHSCAISKYGTFFAWGCNRYGQCAFDNNKKEYENIYTPTKVDIGATNMAFKVQCGRRFNILLTQKGDVLSFGNNHVGQLGHGDENSKTIFKPKIIQALSSVRAIDIACGSGGSHCLCLSENNCLYTWGEGKVGQLGHGKPEYVQSERVLNEYTPRQLKFNNNDDKIVSIAAGHDHSAFITQNGDLFMFGNGYSGRLGPIIEDEKNNNSNKKRSRKKSEPHQYTPMKVTTLNCRATAVSLGSIHSVVIGIPNDEKKNEDFTIYLEPNQQKQIKGDLKRKVINVSIKNEQLFDSRWNLLSRRFGDEDYIASLIAMDKAKNNSNMDKVKQDPIASINKTKEDSNKNNNNSVQNEDDDDDDDDYEEDDEEEEYDDEEEEED